MKFFTVTAYMAAIILTSALEVGIVRIYDPSFFSYPVLVSTAVIGLLIAAILMLRRPSAS